MTAPFAALEIRLNKAVFSRLANVEIDFGAGIIPAIFDNAYVSNDFGGAATQPMLTLATSAVPASVVGMALVVNGTSYKVVESMPDGTGVSTLRLRV